MLINVPGIWVLHPIIISTIRLVAGVNRWNRCHQPSGCYNMLKAIFTQFQNRGEQYLYNTIQYNSKNMNTEVKASRTITMTMEGWRQVAVLTNQWNLNTSRAIEAAIQVAHQINLEGDKDYQKYLKQKQLDGKA